MASFGFSFSGYLISGKYCMRSCSCLAGPISLPMKPRKLRVERHEPFYGGCLGSVIRLKGKWQTDAGFHPGASVAVKTPSPGVIELRINGPAQLQSEDFKAVIAGFEKLGL